MFTPEEYQKTLKYFENKDPIIHKLLQDAGYLKPPPSRSLFSWLVASIIGQRIRFSVARNLRRTLYIHLGKNDFTPEELLDAFPTKEDLVEIKIPEVQARTLYLVTTHLNDHPEDIATPKAFQELIKLKGIGPWTIQNTLIMYSLGSTDTANITTDYLLKEDLIIKRGIKALYGEQSNINEITDQWSPYRGIVTWYLWDKFS